MTYTKTDIVVRVAGPEAILPPAEVILGYYGFEPEKNGRPALFDITLEFGSIGSSVPVEFDLLTSDWFGCQVYGSTHETLVVRGRSRLTIDKRTASASMVIAGNRSAALDASDPALFLLLTFALVHALQSQGRYILHGAAVSDEDGNGILILGESDTGKSTLTMSLIRQGWGYLSDDSLVVTRTDDGIMTAPFRTDFGLDPVAERFFPGVSQGAEPWLVGGEKWRVRIRQLYPTLARPSCRPRMLVFPELDPDGDSHLERISAGEAVVYVMRQGSFVFSSGERDDARSQIDLFVSLIGQCKLYRLVSGPDIVHNAELLSRAFSPRLRRGRWPTQSTAGSIES